MSFAKGQRIDVRDENFLVIDVKPITNNNWLIETQGISELVRGKRFHFDTRLDKSVSVINPSETKLPVRKKEFRRDSKSSVKFTPSCIL